MTVIADRDITVPKASETTQALIFDISKASYRVWHIGLLSKLGYLEL